MSTNLIFSGPIGSGKTQVSKAVATTLGLGWTSFGATLKAIAIKQGGPTNRKGLQALGEIMVATKPDELCQRVLAEAKPTETQPVVIDGLRHIEIRDILRRIFWPARLLLIYIDVPEVIRLERLRARDSISNLEIQSEVVHSTEIQVPAEIRSLADLVVDNSGEISVAVSAIVAKVSELNC